MSAQKILCTTSIRTAFPNKGNYSFLRLWKSAGEKDSIGTGAQIWSPNLNVNGSISVIYD
jgi:hypothetical protein